MISADTNVWVDHFRQPDPDVVALLADDRLVIHPFVVGELVLGGLSNRPRSSALLRALQPAPVVDHATVIDLISEFALVGTGIGYVDLHLLASVHLSRGTRLWTRDKRLRAVAERIDVAAPLP